MSFSVIEYGKENVTKYPIPWNRTLLKKLVFRKPGNKIPVSYGTRRFIATFTISRQLSQK